MITKKVQPRYNNKGQLCGTHVEYRIFGLPVFVKTLELPKVDANGCEQPMYFDF